MNLIIHQLHIRAKIFLLNTSYEYCPRRLVLRSLCTVLQIFLFSICSGSNKRNGIKVLTIINANECHSILLGDENISAMMTCNIPFDLFTISETVSGSFHLHTAVIILERWAFLPIYNSRAVCPVDSCRLFLYANRQRGCKVSSASTSPFKQISQ